MARRILVVDDDPALLDMMSLSLRKEGFDVCSAASVADARETLAGKAFDLVISDIYLGDGTGIDLLDDIRAAASDTKIILVTAQATVETAAAAAEAGVFDYLAKPFTLDDLIDTVGAALGASPSPDPAPPQGPESMIIGSHPTIVEVYKAVARVAPFDVPVLIRGASGTGKELVARAIHRYGAGPDAPFVAINCGAIPENLLESELFGHRRGAFTGAVKDHCGAIESAREGTIFLDEVGELPPSLQVKLLRFLQNNEIRPVGSQTSISVPVRVVAATHRNLEDLIESGAIREDFYYRLAGYEIMMPTLAERPSDIPLLVDHFRRSLEQRLGRSFDGPTAASLAVLQAHQWPGNVRELEHLVQKLVIDHQSLADAEMVRRALPAPDDEQQQALPGPAIGDNLTLADLERLHIEAVLRKCDYNKSRSAAILGIDRKSLYRKARRFGVELDAGDEAG